MLLSFCADPSSHRSTVTFMNNDNLFNVAVTRARHRQVIFTGLDARHLPQDHLLGQYLDYASECLEPDKPEDHTSGGTAFEREVGQTLRQRNGYKVYLGYPVAGFAVDVVAQYGGRALAIACDGDPERHAPLPGEVSLDSSQRPDDSGARGLAGASSLVPPLATRPRAGAGGDRRDDGR